MTTYIATIIVPIEAEDLAEATGFARAVAGWIGPEWIESLTFVAGEAQVVEVTP